MLQSVAKLGNGKPDRVTPRLAWEIAHHHYLRSCAWNEEKKTPSLVAAH
jgi:hypothetical protein